MRRKRSINVTLVAGDPGKDLFAYLFLLIMVFSFMLLMSVEQSESNQNAPDQGENGKSSFSQVLEKNVAALEVKNTKLLLRFGKDLYDPSVDMDKLVQDERLTIKKEGEIIQKILYIKKEENENVSLFNYLDTFKIFSDHKITIAFVKVVL